MTLIFFRESLLREAIFLVKDIEPFKKVNTICCMLLMTSIVVCFINDVKILLRRKTLKWGFWGHNYSNLE